MSTHDPGPGGVMKAAIVGSGFTAPDAPGCFSHHLEATRTPYGDPSGAPVLWEGGGRQAIVLARHGVPHRLAPHQINYRANLWLLQHLGVEEVIATQTVGAITAPYVPGDLALPNQIVDYTWGRDQTYSAPGNVLHVDFTEPFSSDLRARVLALAAGGGVRVHDRAVYGCTQGPRLESAGEIERMARDGCDLVGMTLMPEAGLARELDLSYASLCLVVNPAAGRAGSRIDTDAMRRVMETGMRDVGRLVFGFLDLLEQPG